MAESTPSGIPMEVSSAEEFVEEMAPERPVKERKKAQKDDEVEVEETSMVLANPKNDDDDNSGDDELDEIIERVIEVVKARRAGQPNPPRRRDIALGNPAVKANPDSNKVLIWTGAGLGVGLIGLGLWWYFKKKE